MSEALRQEASIEQQADAKANAYSNRANIAIERRCRRLPANRQTQCVREENQAARDGRHDEYDLEAQKVTANWTRFMGIAAIAGTGFGIVGVALVLATFWANKQSAEAAHRAVELQIQSERGYVHVEMAHIYGADGASPILELGTRNRGESDSVIRSIRWSISDGPEYPTKFDHLAPMLDLAKEKEGGPFRINIAPHEARPGRYIGGVINYTTLGRTFQTYFCLRVREELRRGPDMYHGDNAKGDDWPDDT